MIVRVKVVFRKTIVGDWRFDYLSGSHLQSQVKSVSQMMVFMPLVVVLIGQFCRNTFLYDRKYNLYPSHRNFSYIYIFLEWRHAWYFLPIQLKTVNRTVMLCAPSSIFVSYENNLFRVFFGSVVLYPHLSESSWASVEKKKERNSYKERKS